MVYLIRIAVVLAVLAASASFGEESVKLRYVASLYADGAGGMFNAPQGIACGAGTQIIVADTGNGRVSRFRFENGSFTAAGAQQWPELARPSRLQIGSQGDLYALDDKTRRVARFSSAGAFLAYVEPPGKGQAGLFVPRSFKLDAKDNVYLLDIGSEQVVVLDPAGAVLRTIAFPAAYGFFSDLAVAPNGAVYLIDTVQRMVYIVQPQSTEMKPLTASLKEYVLFPTSVTIDRNGMLYITDQNGGSVLLLNPAGGVVTRQLAAGWKEGLLRYPSQVCINGSGEIFIADRENNRIQVFAAVK
ncbi:MAG: NHL repeat-containing protein [Nitrospirota bacterium]